MPSVNPGNTAGNATAAAMATAPTRRPLRASESVSGTPECVADGPADLPHPDHPGAALRDQQAEVTDRRRQEPDPGQSTGDDRRRQGVDRTQGDAGERDPAKPHREQVDDDSDQAGATHQQ